MNKLMNGHEFHSCNSQTGEMLDGPGVRQSRVSSPQFLGDVRVSDRKTFNVRFINYRLVRLRARMSVIAPIEKRIDHHRLWHERRAVFIIGSTVRIVEEMGKDRLVPLHLAFNRPRVRIEQQLGRIAAMSFRWGPGSVDSKAVALARPEIGQIAVPAKASYLRQFEPCLISLFVEQAKFHSLGDF